MGRFSEAWGGGALIKIYCVKKVLMKNVLKIKKEMKESISNLLYVEDNEIIGAEL